MTTARPSPLCASTSETGAEIALAVVIEEGGEGSDYAVPVADKVLRAFFELTGRRERGLILPKTEGGPVPVDQEQPAASEQTGEPTGDADADTHQSDPGIEGSPLLE